MLCSVVRYPTQARQQQREICDMRTIIIVSFLAIGSSTSMAQTPQPIAPPGLTPSPSVTPQKTESFFRDDGQPTDKVLLRASRACHAHNPGPEAKENCAVVDNQITKRATETGAAPEITNRATELAH